MKRKIERDKYMTAINWSVKELMFSSISIDISIKGLRLESPKKFFKGDQIIIAINGTKVKGSIVWCQKFGLHYQIGIEFYRLTGAQNKKIVDILSTINWNKPLMDN